MPDDSKPKSFSEQWETAAQQYLGQVKSHINSLGLKPLEEIYEETPDHLDFLHSNSTGRFSGHTIEYFGTLTKQSRVTPIFIPHPAYRRNQWGVQSTESKPIYRTYLIGRNGALILQEVAFDKVTSKLASKFYEITGNFGRWLAIQAPDANGYPTAQTWGNLIITGLIQHVQHVVSSREANLAKDKKLIHLLSKLELPTLVPAEI